MPTAPEARAEFLKTGVMPETKADPSPAKEHPANGDKPEGKTAPASEPGDKQEPRRSNADTRLNELLDDLREAGLTPKALKSFKQDYKRAEAAEPARQETPSKPTEGLDEFGLKIPIRPKAADYEGKTWAEYEAAKDQFSDEQADYKASRKLEEFKVSQRNESAQKELDGKLAEAEKRYGEEAKGTISKAASTIFNDAKIPGAVKALVNDSPVLTDLLYVLGSKEEDMADFIQSAQASPGAAIRKLVLIEKLVIEELAKSGKSDTDRGEDGKFQKAPEKKLTAAPPPPKEVDGTKAAPPDASEAAYKRGDARAYIEAENLRELRQRKGR